MRSLRSRLILSHLLPLLITIPLIGIALAYLLETQVLLTNLSNELTQQAALTALIVSDQPNIWHDAAQAQLFVARLSTQSTTELSLVEPDGTLFASNDKNFSDKLGQPIELPDLPTVLAGKKIVNVNYSFNLEAEIVEILTPVIDSNQKVVGVVRLTQALSGVQDRFLSLRYLIIGALGLELIIAVILAVFIALRLERPLKAVTQAIYNIAEGQTWHSVPEQGPKETRQLAQAFNALIDRLRLLEEARRRLLANLVHEVGRPIGAVQAAIQALLSGADKDPHLRNELLTGIEAELNRLHPLLDNLTKLHDQVLGVLELHRQSTDLTTWLPPTLAPWREAALAKDLSWQADIPASLPPITIDQDRMAQVIGNLVSNAIKYTPAGGSVLLAAGVTTTELWLKISDSGIGLTEEEQVKIFEPFFRSNRTRRFPQGMGLGLTIAHDLVVAHNGRLTVESSPQQGSHFTIWLPME